MSNKMGEPTTIQIDAEVRDELKRRGMKGETYDDIIRRLLRKSEKNDRT